MDTYDIAVIGAGPAGTMAAIRASQLKKKVVLIERNDAIGKKVLLTGKGRCNVTNIAPMDEFIEKFGEGGEFFRTAFSRFFNDDLIDFLKNKGLEVKIERQGRVFPVTDNAVSIIEVLGKYLADLNVQIMYNTRVKCVRKLDGVFDLASEGGVCIKAKKAILASGGVSYKKTGSGGDGFKFAKEFGHTITTLRPGLVPVRAKEEWVKNVQGLTLRNVRLTLMFGKRKLRSDVGELLFTHFGVSGPIILDLSSKIAAYLEGHDEARLSIDLKPGLVPEQIEKKLLEQIRLKGVKDMKNFLKEFLPLNLIPIFINLSGLDQAKKANQITQKERRAIMSLFKALPLTLIGTLPIEEAMVTASGVCMGEINPRTMESKIVPGLYFAGETIEGAASSGGYNLQQAFSTGYLAGQSAAHA